VLLAFNLHRWSIDFIMGTPLPKIPTEQGLECDVCPESGGPFPGGPTPKSVIMVFTDFSEGDLWLDVYRKELNAGLEVFQSGLPCGWVASSENFDWFFRFDGGSAIVSIFRPVGPPEFAFTVAGGVPCQVGYDSDIVAPTGVIAFGGRVDLTWEAII
jgi:hypothetical protein